MFKYSFRIKTTLLKSLRSKKQKPFKCYIFAKRVITTLFLCKVTFEGLLDLQMSPLDYDNIFYVEVLIWDQNNFAKVTSEQKTKAL